MKKKRRGLAGLLVTILLLSLLAGCGKKEIDAEKAVDAYLRAETKGEFEDYAKLVGEKEEDLKEEYEETLEELTSVFDEVKSVGMDFGDDMHTEIKNVLGSVKYEITGSTKDDDGNYTVDVNVYPSDICTLFFNKAVEVAQNSSGSTEELGEQFIQALRDAIAEQSYGDAVAHQVHLDYDEDDKKYEINEDDINTLATDFFDDYVNSLYQPSGTVYDNPYYNWTKTEWDAASDEEKTNCCMAMIQEIQGLTDEQMASIDLNDASIQAAVQQIKEGIDLSFSSGTGLSIGDLAGVISEQMGM